jgi:predicted SAM-dependent methyltransferase
MTARSYAGRIPGVRQLATSLRSGRSRGARLLQDVRFQVKRARRQRLIDAYLRTHSERMLHLGAGSNLYEGWLNTDVVNFRRLNRVVYLDARNPFPLPDCSFDLVFTEHMIEHLSYPEGRQCLAECHRVLRSGGRIRVATPSIDRLIQLYEPELTELQRRYMRWATETFITDVDVILPGFIVNNMLRNFGHKFVYDEQTLRHALETSGFVDVEVCPVGESPDPRLAGLERHMRSVAEFNAFETIVLEGRRL